MNSSLQLRGFQITFNNDRPMGDLFYQQKKSIENDLLCIAKRRCVTETWVLNEPEEGFVSLWI